MMKFSGDLKKSRSTVEEQVYKAYLITGGSEEQRKKKSSQLCDGDQFGLIGVYKSQEAIAVIFAEGHECFEGMNFEKAVALAGSKELGSEFKTTTFGKEEEFGIIRLSPIQDSLQQEWPRNPCVNS